MADRYEIHFGKNGDIQPRSEFFTSFAPFLAFVRANRSESWPGRVKLVLPARASEEERAEVRKFGLAPN